MSTANVPQASHDRPFAGLRVLDTSQGLAGPYCGMLLAQYGAEVIKLEPPDGDWARLLGTRHGSHSALDYMGNRGKRSIAVDLKAAGAVDMVRRMAAQCDVMIENNRPGVAAKLGIGYEDIARVRADIIYLSVTGFGQSGEMAMKPATDMVIQGFSGMMSTNKDDAGKPRKIGFVLVDEVTAMYAFQAVSAALYARKMGAGGKRLDVSLMQSAAALLSSKIVEACLEGDDPAPLNTPGGSYRTQDGWIAITLSKEPFYVALCKATGREDLAADPRFANFQLRAQHIRYLEDQFAEVLKHKTTAQWMEIFSAHGVLAAHVNSVGDWTRHPDVVALNVAPPATDGVRRFVFPTTPGAAPLAEGDPRADWPDVGAHGVELLTEFGFSGAEIEELQARGALAQPVQPA